MLYEVITMGVGLTAQAVATQLRSAYYGKKASEIQVNGESYEIDVRLADADKDSLADLAYFHVTLPDGGQAPLESMAILTYRITSYNVCYTKLLRRKVRVLPRRTALKQRKSQPGFRWTR